MSRDPLGSSFTAYMVSFSPRTPGDEDGSFTITTQTVPSCCPERCRQLIREELMRLDQKAARVATLEKLIAALVDLTAIYASTPPPEGTNLLPIIDEHIEKLRSELQQLKET